MNHLSSPGRYGGKNKLRISLKPRIRMRQKLSFVVAVGYSLFIIGGLVLYFQFSNPQKGHAAVSGDFRSKQTGNWSSSSTWEKFNGTSWVGTASAPSSSDGVIEIQSGHAVTLTADVTADQIIIDAGATVQINSSRYLYVANGAGTDLTVNGTLTINNGGYLSQNSSTAMVIAGTVVCSNGATHTINSSSTVTINSGGLYRRDGGIMTTSSGMWIVNSGGTFRHNMNGGTLPSATWNTGSTCEITGTTTTAPASLSQTYSNFTWNCASQTAQLDHAAALNNINGNFTVASTGTGNFFIDKQGNNSTITVGGNYIVTGGSHSGCLNGSVTINVGGNFIQSGGTFSFNRAGGTAYGSNSALMTVAGNITITGGTMDLSQYDGTPTSKGWAQVNLSGNLSITSPGLMTVSSPTNARGQIYFVGTSVQTCIATSGTVTNSVDYFVNSGAIISIGSSSILPSAGTFTLYDGGGIMIGSTNGITQTAASGNIQVTGTRTYGTGADYTYNGTAAQVSGDGLPSTVRNLTLNNSSGLTLTNSVSVSSVITLTTGILYTGSNELYSTNNSTTSITSYGNSDYIVGNLRRAVLGSGTYDYPLGTASYYELLTITLSSTTGFSNILGTFVNANPIDITLPLSGMMINGYSLDWMLNYGYWTLTPNSILLTGTYAVTLNEQGHTDPANITSNYCVLKRSNALSLWGMIANASGTPSEANGVAQASRSGYTSFSHFAIGYGGPGHGALPIKLLYFRAKMKESHVDLSWATSSEVNNNYFTVERSSDGESYETVLTKPGAGNSTVNLYYTAVDENPMKGTSYYRLKQTDYDGKFSYSPICVIDNKSINVASAISVESVGPNPFSDYFNLNYKLASKGEVEIQIVSNAGQVVYQDAINAEKGSNTYTFNNAAILSKGIYFVTLISNGEKVTKRMMKE